MLLNTSSTRTYDLRARTRAGVATQTGQALDESPSLINIDNSSNEVAPRVEGPVPIAEATTAIRSYSDVVASRSPLPQRERPAVPRLHCPRAGPGQGQPIFAGPWHGPLRVGPASLALARGQLDPGSVGSGQGRARADPAPLTKKIKNIHIYLLII